METGTKRKTQRTRKCSWRYKHFENGSQDETFRRIGLKMKEISWKVEDENSIELVHEFEGMSQKVD